MRLQEFDKPSVVRSINGGTQRIYRYDNNRGASVVKHNYSYGGDAGLYELAVIRFNGGDWKIDYKTRITSDVEGWLTPEQVEGYLRRIKKYKEIK